MIAEVIPIARLPKKISHFDYDVPQKFEGKIKIGQLVKISLKGKIVNGLITNLKDKPTELKTTLKQIIKISDYTINFDDKHFKFLRWLADYYLTSPAFLLKTFLPEPLLRNNKFNIKSKLSASSLGVPSDSLEEIKRIFTEIIFSKKSQFLLHYHSLKNKIAIILKITEKTILDGRDVLILEPQIPDIENCVPYFIKLFPQKIAILHGKLSRTEYWQEWQKIKSGTAKIVFGTRSSLFAPLKNLGLIIVDNENSPDFKQSDQNPRYDARNAALHLARLSGAKIIFTSLAPRPETFFSFKNNPDAQYFQEGKCDSKGILIDMNNEIKNKNFSSLSGRMQEAISEVIAKKQKVILLLNRLGRSTLMLCRDCDYIFRCKNCQMPMVCHDDNNTSYKFVCRNCGIEEPGQIICPECRGTNIKYLGTGTQKVEKEIKKIFPGVKILRIDKNSSMLNIQNQLSSSYIFIGTQFFIRNFLSNIKNIGLIGVISADTLIYRPDFRSGEKIFLWLTSLVNFGQQIKSPVFIQTFFPNNFFIQSAVTGDYEKFYQQELSERRDLLYPPFGKLIKLLYSHSKEKKCILESNLLFKELKAKCGRGVEILLDEKPRKEKKRYFSKIVIKFPELLANEIKNILLKTVPDEWTIDIDPESVI